MVDQINYSGGPIDEVEIVADFLPPPEELFFRDDTAKVKMKNPGFDALVNEEVKEILAED